MHECIGIHRVDYTPITTYLFTKNLYFIQIVFLRLYVWYGIYHAKCNKTTDPIFGITN